MHSHIAHAAPSPVAGLDAAVVALADECRREFAATTKRWAGQDLPDDALDPALELYDRLIETPASTIAGITAKARALLVWAPNAIDMASGSTQLTRVIAEEIVTLSERGVTAAPLPPHSATVEAQLLGYIGTSTLR